MIKHIKQMANFGFVMITADWIIETFKSKHPFFSALVDSWIEGKLIISILIWILLYVIIF
jgi:hypothetical protein